jgi:hypothetical protein
MDGFSVENCQCKLEVGQIVVCVRQNSDLHVTEITRFQNGSG